jgi:hypothetical protein
VIIGTTAVLAVGFAADGLAALELRKLEDLLTVKTTPFTHMNGVVSPRQTSAPTPADFRNYCRVPTASPPMASSADYNAGENAVVSNRG